MAEQKKIPTKRNGKVEKVMKEYKEGKLNSGKTKFSKTPAIKTKKK
jgi:hypothetical protein